MATQREIERLVRIEEKLEHLIGESGEIKATTGAINGKVRTLEIKNAILEANGVTMCDSIEKMQKRINDVEKGQYEVAGASAALGAAAGMLATYLKGIFT